MFAGHIFFNSNARVLKKLYSKEFCEVFENDFGHMGFGTVLDEAHAGLPILGYFFEHNWPYVKNNMKMLATKVLIGA